LYFSLLIVRRVFRGKLGDDSSISIIGMDLLDILPFPEQEWLDKRPKLSPDKKFG
jgi:hypothetical protein